MNRPLISLCMAAFTALVWLPATRAQTISRDPIWPAPGVYVVGKVVTPAPLVIDITAAEGLAAGAPVEIRRPKNGWTLVGTMTVVKITATGAEGTIGPESSPPAAGDVAVFHRSATAPPEAARPRHPPPWSPQWSRPRFISGSTINRRSCGARN